MTFLKVSDLGKLRQGEWVVKDVALNLKPFSKLAIAGETGSGKSSLLQMISGIINPDKGEVIFEDNRVKKMPEEKLLPGHPGIAYLSQQFELPPHMRVEEVLAYANELEQMEAQRLYEICQVNHLVKRRTDQLSGGERQRIALARLLGTSPRLLLLDEPYSNLDPIHKHTLKSVINDISEKLAMTCILVSHDPLDTISWADEIIVLRHGQILQHDMPEKIYYQPVNEYAAGLFGKYNRWNDAMQNVFGEYLPSTHDAGWCIRPHQWHVSRRAEKGVEGKIKEVYFLGSGYELLIEYPDFSMHALTTESGWKKGDKVFIWPQWIDLR